MFDYKYQNALRQAIVFSIFSFVKNRSCVTQVYNYQTGAKCILPGAHHPKRPSTLYPWSNLCPDCAIFRNVFPANYYLHCGPYMTEINAEKNGDRSAKRSPGASFVRFPQPFFFLSALISAVCGPQRRQTFAGNNSKNSSIGCTLRVMDSWFW